MNQTEGPLVHLREHMDIVEADLKLIGARTLRGARLLDIGAGRAVFAQAATRRGIDAYALDLQVEASALWGKEGVKGVIGDGGRTPFAASSFDVVRMKEVLEHVEDPLGFVREGKRLLRDGGILVAHVPTPWSQFYPVANFWDDYTHVRPISRYGLQRLFEDAGMRIELLEGYMSGRNGPERVLGKVLGRVFPHMYRVVARKDGGKAASLEGAGGRPGHR
jgi:SAM-dependent methyltransferase